MKVKDHITITYKPSARVTVGQVPMIRIANRRLKEVGFKVGDKAKITYEPNKITIKKEEAQND